MIQRFQFARLALSVALLMVTAVVASGGVTTVSLRSTVRLVSDGPITLAQVGLILGDQSEQLAGLVIEELLTGESGQWQGLAVTDLRELLEREPGVHAGSIVIEGTGVSVRKTDSSRAVAVKILAVDAEDKEITKSGSVVRSHVERWVRDRYQVGNDLLRMSFRSNDEGFLSTPTDSRLVEIREISKRGRTAIRVIVLENLEVAEEQALVFGVEVFRSVLIARKRVNRGTVLEDSDVITERRWVSPEDLSAGIDEALGMALSKTIHAGQLIQEQHIELPLVIRRGDIVTAKSISGSVIVTIRGRAKANARLREAVEIESMNGENVFRAQATGKGKAVIIREGLDGGLL